MSDSQEHAPDLTDLRRRAETLLKARPAPATELSAEDAMRLIHELQVHQIELEIQNEELKQTQSQLEESRDRYSDLYDYAPVGYLTLDQWGKILEANFTTATLLGVARDRLVGQYFGLFLPQEDQKSFRTLLQGMEEHQRRRAELHLKKEQGEGEVILLDVMFVRDQQGQGRYRISLTDITGLKHIQEEMHRHQEDLEELVADRTTELLEVNEELREANENFQAFFTAAPLAIGMFDAEGKFLDINPTATRIFGWTREELQGQPLRPFSQEMPEDSQEVLQRILQGEPCTGIESQRQRKDGSFLDVSFSAAPVYDSRGNIRGFIGLAEDVTVRKRSEEALKTQARVLESMAEGVSVTDHRGTIIYTNPAFNAMFGYQPGELLGRHSNILNYYPPEENVNLVKDILRRVARAGVWSGEFRNRRKDGHPFYTSARISALTVRGKKLFIAVQEDITERRLAELALRDSEERLRLAQQVAQIGTFELELQTGIISWTPELEAMYGLPPGGFARTQAAWEALVHPDDLANALRQLDRSLETGEPVEAEWRVVWPDGSVHWLAGRWRVFKDESGRPQHVTGVNIDITDRKQAEEESQRLFDAIHLEKEKLAALINSISDEVWFADMEKQFTLANPSALREFGLDTIEDITVEKLAEGLEVYRADGSPRPIEETPPLRALHGELVRNDEEIIRTPAIGELRHRQVSASPVRDGSGNIIGSVSVVRDITERKRDEEALRRARDELEDRVAERTASLRIANAQLLQEIEERRQVEGRLRESEARFAAFMEHLPDLAIMRDLEGRHVFINDAWVRITGKTRNEAWQKSLDQLWPPEEARRLKQLDQQVLETGEPLVSLVDLKLTDGPHYFLANRFPIKDREGIPYMIGLVATDISEQMLAQKEAKRQTRLFEAFFENAITPLVFLDPQFNFIRVNQAYARACQREIEEFVGRNHFDLYPSDAKEIFTEVLNTKVPFQTSARPFEFPEYPERGVTYWDWSLVPIFDDAGEVESLVFALKDVTVQVKAEEARNRLVAILENTPDFVGTANYRGQLLYLNQAGRAMVGVEADADISHLRVLQLHPPWVQKLILEEGSPTAIREGAWQAESALLNWEGREIPVSQVILAHKDGAGRVQFFSTIVRDISDLKEAQESSARQAAILKAINWILWETLAKETGAELGRACLEVVQALTTSRFGFIIVIKQGKFEVLAVSGDGWNQRRQSRFQQWLNLQNSKSLGLFHQTICEKKGFIANDPATDPAMAGFSGSHLPLTAYLGLPLISEERPLGLMALGGKDGGYTPADQEAMEILAPVVTEALMHHHAKEALKKSEIKLRYLADQLLTTQEQERKRLAGELHDELGHALLSLKLHFRGIERKLPPEQEKVKEEIRGQLAEIDTVINEVRRLYHDLSPGSLEDLGLSNALIALIDDFAADLEQITWQVDLPDLKGLFPLPVETIIYRLVQEALTNIGKHAEPSRVMISAFKEGHQLCLTIEDNGKGFNLAEVLENKGELRGLGLAAMEERLQMLGGSFQVWSKQDEGTRLTFTIPIPPQEEQP